MPDAPGRPAEDGVDSNGNGARVVEPVAVRRPAYDADDLEIPRFLRRSR